MCLCERRPSYTRRLNSTQLNSTVVAEVQKWQGGGGGKSSYAPTIRGGGEGAQHVLR